MLEHLPDPSAKGLQRGGVAEGLLPLWSGLADGCSSIKLRESGICFVTSQHTTEFGAPLSRQISHIFGARLFHMSRFVRCPAFQCSDFPEQMNLMNFEQLIN